MHKQPFPHRLGSLCVSPSPCRLSFLRTPSPRCLFTLKICCSDYFQLEFRVNRPHGAGSNLIVQIEASTKTHKKTQNKTKFVFNLFVVAHLQNFRNDFQVGSLILKHLNVGIGFCAQKLVKTLTLTEQSSFPKQHLVCSQQKLHVCWASWKKTPCE